MKKKLIFLCILIFIVYILFFPQDAVTAAADGLVLWYERVLPSLLPYAILSNILIYSGFTGYLVKLLYPLLRLILPASRNGSFVLLSGFLFGFPMGSKNCAEMLKCGQLEYQEAEILFMVTNNISPVFISSYILCQELHMPSLIPLSYLVIFLPPLIAGRLLFFFTEKKQSVSNHSTTYKKPASGSQINFKIIDAGIMNGFETLTRLGGYIILIFHDIFHVPAASTARNHKTDAHRIDRNHKRDQSCQPVTPYTCLPLFTCHDFYCLRRMFRSGIRPVR